MRKTSGRHQIGPLWWQHSSTMVRRVGVIRPNGLSLFFWRHGLLQSACSRSWITSPITGTDALILSFHKLSVPITAFFSLPSPANVPRPTNGFLIKRICPHWNTNVYVCMKNICWSAKGKLHNNEVCSLLQQKQRPIDGIN